MCTQQKKRAAAKTNCVNKYLFEDITHLPNFKLKTTVVTCFMQFQDTVLVLKRASKEDQSFFWGVPGGKVDPDDPSEIAALTREVFEETGLQLKADDYNFVAKRYARVPGWDYILHLYQLKFDIKPSIKLSEEHCEAYWVPISRFKTLKLVKGQVEAFDVVFANTVKKYKYK